MELSCECWGSMLACLHVTFMFQRPAKVLRSTLEKIYTKILQDQRLSASQTNADDLKKIAAQVSYYNQILYQ